MPDTKIVGYSLLTIGVLVILFAGINVYQVFTKKIQPIQLFNFSGITIDASQLGAGLDTSALPPEAQQFIKPTAAKPTEIIPADVLNQTSNIFAHLFLMGFIASMGYKLAGLGVMMLRPIEVKVKTQQQQAQPQ